MAYLTDRKRAVGMGAAGTGTGHFWGMTVSSTALLVLVPLFVWIIGPLLGEPRAVVIAALSQPLVGAVTLLTLVVGLLHFKNGVRVLIEDYVHGLARKVWIIIMTCVSYALIAASSYALILIAVMGA